MSVRGALRSAVLFPLSMYSKYVPVERGKWKIQRLAFRILNGSVVIVRTRHQSRFQLSFPQDEGWEQLHLRRTWEEGTTSALTRLLRTDDVVLDIGANIGWYTVLAGLIATQGQCHAFEPVPHIFEELRTNCSLNGLGETVVLNQLALGDRETTVELYIFSGLPHGHASVSALGRSDYSTTRARMITLDQYLTEHALNRVDLIKLDVEGAEMAVLRGGMRVFELDPPPIWVVEMNEITSKSFGYAPSDLLRFIGEHGDYGFYRIVHSSGRLAPMKSLEDYEHSDNVLCVPHSRSYCFRALGL